jgi:hypothetical protein
VNQRLPYTINYMQDKLCQTFSALFEQGLHAARTKNLVRAADLFGKAIELEPNHAAAHGNRATVLLELK